jgi:hypothetical protein
MGNKGKAQEAWQKALELDGNLETVKRKLENIMSREAAVISQ